jgi:hypothetical protein
MDKQVEIETFDKYISADVVSDAITAAKSAFYPPEILRDQEKAKEAFQANMVKSLSKAVTGHVYGAIKTRVDKSYNIFCAVNGMRPETGFEQWDSDCDDMLAGALAGQFRKAVGIDWTEDHTVDANIHEGMRRDELCLEAAEQYIEAIRQRGPAEALSHYGVEPETVNAAFETMWGALVDKAGNKGKPSNLTIAQARRRVEEIVIPYVQNAGDRLNLDALQTLLASAADRDPLIASASITELGGEPGEDHGAFRIYASDAGSVWMEDVISNAIEGAYTPMEGADEPAGEEIQVGEEAQAEATPEAETQGHSDPGDIPAALDRRKESQSPPPTPPAQAADEAGVAGQPVDDGPDGAVTDGSTGGAIAGLRVLRDHTALKDQEIADIIGASRASVINYYKGTTHWEATPEQAEAVRLALSEYKSKIDAALLLYHE